MKHAFRVCVSICGCWRTPSTFIIWIITQDPVILCFALLIVNFCFLYWMKRILKIEFDFLLLISGRLCSGSDWICCSRRIIPKWWCIVHVCSTCSRFSWSLPSPWQPTMVFICSFSLPFLWKKWQPIDQIRKCQSAELLVSALFHFHWIKLNHLKKSYHFFIFGREGSNEQWIKGYGTATGGKDKEMADGFGDN